MNKTCHYLRLNINTWNRRNKTTRACYISTHYTPKNFVLPHVISSRLRGMGRLLACIYICPVCSCLTVSVSTPEKQREKPHLFIWLYCNTVVNKLPYNCVGSSERSWILYCSSYENNAYVCFIDKIEITDSILKYLSDACFYTAALLSPLLPWNSVKQLVELVKELP